MKHVFLPAKPGDAIINVLACFPDLGWLEREFDPIYFLDFCAGLESAVLHNTLFASGPVFHATATAENSVVTALAKSGTLKIMKLEADDPLAAGKALLDHDRSKKLLAIMPKWIPDIGSDLYTAILAHGTALAGDVAFEDLMQTPVVLWAHALPLYLQLPDVMEEQKTFRHLRGTLIEQYSGFRDYLYSKIGEAEGDTVIKIPPIALEVLEHARDMDDLGNALMDVREKYRKLRESFAELDELLRSPRVSFGEKNKEKARMMKSMSKLCPSSDSGALTVATAALQDIGNLKAPYKVAIEELVNLSLKMRLRPLHATKKRYLNLSRKKLQDVVRHLFGHQLTRHDVEKVQKYHREVEKLQAEAGLA